MPILNILQFPDPRLKNISAPIDSFDVALSTLIDNMFETLYKTEGAVGLAAIQVNIAKQLIVIDISPERNQPICLINPQIHEHRETVESEEGCLSFPGVYAKVKRAKEIEISFLDRFGTPQRIVQGGFLSICMQHEMDHLKGITFYDRLPPVKQHMLRKKYEKLRRQALNNINE